MEHFPTVLLTRLQNAYSRLVHEQSVAEKRSESRPHCEQGQRKPASRLVMAWEQDLLETLPRFPPPREQRNVAGGHYLTKAEINALYLATCQLKRPRGWTDNHSIGRYWRSALALFFNYGLDTGTIWKSTPIHEPILWRHITWHQRAPDGGQKDSCRWRWIYFRRVKTGKTFYRPNEPSRPRTYSQHHAQSPEPNDPVFRGGGCRPIQLL